MRFALGAPGCCGAWEAWGACGAGGAALAGRGCCTGGKAVLAGAVFAALCWADAPEKVASVDCPCTLGCEEAAGT